MKSSPKAEARGWCWLLASHLDIQSHANSWRNRNKYDQTNQRLCIWAVQGRGCLAGPHTWHYSYAACGSCLCSFEICLAHKLICPHTHSHTYMPEYVWEISRIWWSCCQAEILAKDNAVSTPTDRKGEGEWGQVPSAFINHSSTRFARLHAMPPRSQKLKLLMDGRRGCQMALAEWPTVSGIYALSGPQLKSTFKSIITINILL